VVQAESEPKGRIEEDGIKENEAIPLADGVSTLFLKVDCDFTNRKDEAYFYWSLNGEQWKRIGPSLRMVYTLPHFMGYRFGLFNYATSQSGGSADFDYYRISASIDAQ
ncbi:MAG: hypothetical protein IKX88_16065, partial [Thermoguttaceae bacterium]|nr:hypothetical protein [Thermoguttaceae bacterium]